MAEFLPVDQPVYEIYWPNMDRETNFPTVEQLAALFVQDLRKVQAHGPYQFCGYSTFGLVAYEMAQLLLCQGEDVSLLALFDIYHPKFLQMLTPRELIRYQIMRVVDRLREYSRVLSKGRFEEAANLLLEIIVRKGKSIGWRASRFIFRLTNHPVPKTMHVIESISSNKTYIPMPYPKRFILVRPRDYREKALKDQTVGWSLCATKGIDVYFVPGDHGTMKDKPHVGALVDIIEPHLARTP